MSTQPEMRRKRKSLGAPLTASKPAEAETGRRKGSRSKSIGSGGLDALQKTSGNRRASLAAITFQPKSILKPTAPMSPEIHQRKKGRNEHSYRDNITLTGAEFQSTQPGSKIALRTEEEQQAAAREREEREKKDSRRKSRRVSFAAEATLHTFHEIEYPQDSTVSTDSTRRASSVAGQTPRPPSSAPEPEHQETQPRRRRSSIVVPPPVSFDDDTIASTVYSSDSDGTEAIEMGDDDEDEDEDEGDDDDDSDSSDSDDGTMMTIEGDEMTSASMATAADESTLDEALRVAAQHAGTQRIRSDDEDDEEEVIPSFGWVKKATVPSALGAQPTPNPTDTEPDIYRDGDGDGDGDVNLDMEMDMDVGMDMDITHAAGNIIRRASPHAVEDDADMSMDVTKALGNILGQRSELAVSKGTEDASNDATMEFTMAIGGIHRPTPAGDQSFNGDEEMSMELTTILGNVLGNKTAPQNLHHTPTRTERTVNMEKAMDLTIPVGRILSQQQPPAPTDDDDDATMGMDMTMVMGKILPSSEPAYEEQTIVMDITTALGTILKPQAESRQGAKYIMEKEVNEPDSPDIPRCRSRSPSNVAGAAESPSKTAASNSPGLSAFREKGLRRILPASAAAALNSTPESASRTPTKPTTPSQQGGSTSRKTSSQNKSSPRRTTQNSSPLRKTSAKKDAPKATSLFVDDPKTGASTPTVVLTPQERRLSGVGLDRQGLGSPRVSALLDRRTSIGDSSGDFRAGQAMGKRKVLFQDPRILEQEVDKERRGQDNKDDRRKLMERGANGDQDDRGTTLNLKEMIASMSPKKNPLRGRKSLHVGSARGVLGKRPAELDNPDDEEIDGFKRLKCLQTSPVRNAKLKQPPPRVDATTGMLTNSERNSVEQCMEDAISQSLDGSGGRAMTPRGQGRFRVVDTDSISRTINFNENTTHSENELDEEDSRGRIHLQDFLDMISVRFMELTTSKRRQTLGPITLLEGEEDMSLERCVVAGACTIPMLELYQHSCRELKKYISEGRRIVKEIESETFAENPHLFKEYMSATPDFKALMDNQFKNVKTHARLLSKAMWYEWRTKLQHGLRDGLVQITKGMEGDDESLRQQEELLASSLPAVVAQYEALAKEHRNLEMYARELADCDPEELQAAREELVSAEDRVEVKKKAIAELRRQLEDMESDIEQGSQKKAECLECIKEAERVREECRGWSSTEIHFHKDRVDALEKKYGWAITSISGARGTQVSMAYKRELELVFDMASFQAPVGLGQDQENNSPIGAPAPIDVWYIGVAKDGTPRAVSPEREFFLHVIRDHVRALSQSRTPVQVSRMLHTVRAAWDISTTVVDNIALVNVTFPTKVSKTSDSSIEVRSSFLMPSMTTKVDVALHIKGAVSPDGIDVAVSPEARVIYGENFDAEKITEFLSARISTPSEASEGKRTGLWSDTFVALHDKLMARARK